MQHQEEAREFGNLIGHEILFRSDKYQGVFSPVVSLGLGYPLRGVPTVAVLRLDLRQNGQKPLYRLANQSPASEGHRAKSDVPGARAEDAGTRIEFSSLRGL
jgi:hypothetical protein